jgi:hypothetical protein
MNPTAFAGAVAVEAVVAVKDVFAALPAVFTGALVAIAAWSEATTTAKLFAEVFEPSDDGTRAINDVNR